MSFFVCYQVHVFIHLFQAIKKPPKKTSNDVVYQYSLESGDEEEESRIESSTSRRASVEGLTAMKGKKNLKLSSPLNPDFTKKVNNGWVR